MTSAATAAAPAGDVDGRRSATPEKDLDSGTGSLKSEDEKDNKSSEGHLQRNFYFFLLSAPFSDELENDREPKRAPVAKPRGVALPGVMGMGAAGGAQLLSELKAKRVNMRSTAKVQLQGAVDY